MEGIDSYTDERMDSDATDLRTIIEEFRTFGWHAMALALDFTLESYLQIGTKCGPALETLRSEANDILQVIPDKYEED